MTEDLLKKCLKIEENERISWNELFELKDKYFKTKEPEISKNVSFLNQK